MNINKVSDNLKELEVELESKGYERLPDVIPSINRTKVYVSVDGKIATILSKDGKHSLVYRDIKPVDKGSGKKEYRVSIDGKTHAVHKLVAITYPSFCGVWNEELDIHHIDGNHLNNDASNLICLTKELHRKIHLIQDISSYRESKLREYLEQHLIYNNVVTLEAIEEAI